MSRSETVSQTQIQRPSLWRFRFSIPYELRLPAASSSIRTRSRSASSGWVISPGEMASSSSLVYPSRRVISAFTWWSRPKEPASMLNTAMPIGAPSNAPFRPCWACCAEEMSRACVETPTISPSAP